MKRKDSIIISDDYDIDRCVETGGRATDWHHCISGTDRAKADQDGLVVPMAHSTHMRLHDTDTDLKRKYQRIAQAAWLMAHDFDTDGWMARYGKNYL